MNMYKIRFFLKCIRLRILAGLREKEREKNRRYIRARQLLKYLQNDSQVDTELKALIPNLYKYDMNMLPYDFLKKYEKMKIDIQLDKTCGMLYTVYHDKRLYFKRSMDEKGAIQYMSSIYREQDKDSPHRYKYDVEQIRGKYIADMGAAEGFFALDVIDEAKKVYVFECDKEWLEALKYTFAPYKEKVEFVPCYVAEKDGDETICLDTFFIDKTIDFIKADIEGYEVQMLLGGKRTLSQYLPDMMLCVYHYQDDENKIREILQGYDYSISVTPGYMLILNDDGADKMPYLRHGVLTALKENRT